MFTHWDDSFIPIVKEIWEKYYEAPLSWVVIRYLPIDYIKENFRGVEVSKPQGTYMLLLDCGDWLSEHHHTGRCRDYR